MPVSLLSMSIAHFTDESDELSKLMGSSGGVASTITDFIRARENTLWWYFIILSPIRCFSRIYRIKPDNYTLSETYLWRNKLIKLSLASCWLSAILTRLHQCAQINDLGRREMAARFSRNSIHFHGTMKHGWNVLISKVTNSGGFMASRRHSGVKSCSSMMICLLHLTGAIEARKT